MLVFTGERHAVVGCRTRGLGCCGWRGGMRRGWWPRCGMGVERRGWAGWSFGLCRPRPSTTAGSLIG